MKKILITGARAPAALDLISQFARAGFEVHAADTTRFPLSRGSQYLKAYHRYPSPRHHFEEFERELAELVKNHHFDYILPTCEEVFYISKSQGSLSKTCKILCDSFEKLRSLHHKGDFIRLANPCKIHTPQTQQFECLNDLEMLKNLEEKVLKPVYSRFAAETRLCPTRKELNGIQMDQGNPWIAQEYIAGVEYCSYSFALDGNVMFTTIYQPKYRVGLGAGIYFEPETNLALDEFISDFVQRYNYTGQIAFDFIKTKKGECYVLECNPRATSGVHFLSADIPWDEILGGKPYNQRNVNMKAKMISWAMILFGFKYFFKSPRILIKDFAEAKDPLWEPHNRSGFFYQGISFIEIVCRSIRHRIPLTAAATEDIEWNGNPL